MKQDRYRFFAQVRFFFWEEPYLFKTILTKSSKGVYQRKSKGVY